MFYTYILQSKKDNQLYTGSTKNLKLRFEQHKDGKVVSTKHRRPLKLIYYETCLVEDDARRREKALKSYRGENVYSPSAQIVFHRGHLAMKRCATHSLVLLLMAGVLSGTFFFSAPTQTYAAVTCAGSGFADNGAGQCEGVLTTSPGTGNKTWTVPSDWTNTNAKFECVGAGASGTKSATAHLPGPGGGAGAYASTSAITLTANGSVTYAVGAGATTTAGGMYNATYFNGTASSTASLSCDFGKMATTTTAGGAGGQTKFSTPSAISSTGGSYNGGQGGGVTATTDYGAGGGGGSAGPAGIGKTGGNGYGSAAGGGGGGGGSDGGTSTAGSIGTSSTGGAGGNGTAGTGGGTGGSTTGTAATAGTGGGGQGSAVRTSSTGYTAGGGAIDSNFDSTHGAGGGGGGGGGDTGSSGTGGAGGSAGTYGGGGGGGGGGGTTGGANGAAGTGGQGIIVIIYTPASPPTVTTNFAGAVDFQSANLVGSITSLNGGANATQNGFAYGTVSNLSTVIATTTLGGMTGTGPFNGGTGGLSPTVVYYYRAYATNSAGTGYGSILNFTTGNSTPTRKMRLFEGFKIKFISGNMILRQN